MPPDQPSGWWSPPLADEPARAGRNWQRNGGSGVPRLARAEGGLLKPRGVTSNAGLLGAIGAELIVARVRPVLP